MKISDKKKELTVSVVDAELELHGIDSEDLRDSLYNLYLELPNGVLERKTCFIWIIHYINLSYHKETRDMGCQNLISNFYKAKLIFKHQQYYCLWC